jgi:inhibitor of KinA sporulation pathway (predicted exonuclease)
MTYYICILDFEATCWEYDNENNDKREIIEFPSVLYQVNDNKIAIFISEFQEYVRPTINPVLSSFCTDLTGITQETVNNADIFENVYMRHQQWLFSHIGNYPCYFLTVSHFDLAKFLPNELRNKQIGSYPKTYSRYIDIQSDFENLYGYKLGLTNMLNVLGMKFNGRHHSGIDDCRNTARIFLHLFNNGFRKFKIHSAI